MRRAPRRTARRRPAQPIEVEVTVEPHQDRVGVAVGHPLSTAPGDRLGHAVAGAQQDPLPRLHQPRRRHGGGDDIAVRGDPVVGQLGLDLRDGLAGVVGAEDHRLAGRPDALHGGRRPGDRAVSQPDDAVEVECEGHGRSLSDSTTWPASTPSPPSATTSQRSDLGRVIAPPYDVIDDDGAGPAGCARPAQRGADRPAQRSRRRPALRGGPLPPARLAGRRDLGGGRPTLLHRVPDDGRRRRRRASGSTTGVIGALELTPPGTDILPHEHTTKKAKSDRLDLLRSCRANLSAIWGLSLAKGLTDLLPADERAVGRRGRRRRGASHRVAGGRSSRLCVDLGCRGRAAGGDRRRPPPLRDLAGLPRPSGRRPTARPAAPAPRWPISWSWSTTSSPSTPSIG